jgi:hypothetical protein
MEAARCDGLDGCAACGVVGTLTGVGRGLLSIGLDLHASGDAGVGFSA